MSEKECQAIPGWIVEWRKKFKKLWKITDSDEEGKSCGKQNSVVFPERENLSWIFGNL